MGLNFTVLHWTESLLWLAAIEYLYQKKKKVEFADVCNSEYLLQIKMDSVLLLLGQSIIKHSCSCIHLHNYTIIIYSMLMTQDYLIACLLI